MGQLKWQMSFIKNGDISIYCYFNKIIKEPGAYSTLVFDQI